MESLAPSTLEECVTVQQQFEWAQNRIRSLEAELGQLKDTYEQDATYALFFALNRKGNELAFSLNSFSLRLTSEGKEPERFQNIIKNLPEFYSTLTKMKNEYLKIPDEEMEEVEKRGIPLIEQSRVSGKKLKK